MKIWISLGYNQIFIRTSSILFFILLLVNTDSHAQFLQLHVDSQQNQSYLRSIYADTTNFHTSVRPFLDFSEGSIYLKPSKEKPRNMLYRKIFLEHLIQVKKDDYELAVSFLPDAHWGKILQTIKE